MPQGVNGVVMTYLKGTVYVLTPSNDLTTLWVRRLRELTGDMTARFKAIIVSAGTSN